MGIILPINDSCRIESDRYNWIVCRKRGAAWVATTFWQRLDGAVGDCGYQGLANKRDLSAVFPVIDRLAAAESAIAEAFRDPAFPGSAQLALGDDWLMWRDRLGDSGRWRYHLFIASDGIRQPDESGSNRIGTYRTAAFAAQQCLTIRLRLSETLESIEMIAREIIDASSGIDNACTEAGNGGLTRVKFEFDTETSPA